MKLNRGFLLIECLISIIVLAFIVNTVLMISKLDNLEREIVKTYEERI